MPNTTKEAPTIRLFLAPINEPVSGGWYEIGTKPADAREDIRLAVDEVRKQTGSEELRISDAEGLPSSLIPPYGGVPTEKIVSFSQIAYEHGLPTARAFVEVLELLGVLGDDYLREDGWYEAFARSHAGVQDSRTAWAEIRVTDGSRPLLGKVASERGIGYINLDRVRRNMEHDPHTTFVNASDGVHLFYVEEI